MFLFRLWPILNEYKLVKKSYTYTTGKGFLTLFQKEVKRFWQVSFQTIAAPVLTSFLYLLIFGHLLEDYIKIQNQINYTSFLSTGLIMMSVLQNAFANTSSSLIQSKITGNLVFILLAPLSYIEFFLAYVLAAMLRGLAVGLCILLTTVYFIEFHHTSLSWILFFSFLNSAILATLGLIAGIWAEKFDQLAAFQNFFIVPATMLSGVFYSIHTLPVIWQTVSHFNPFFYMIDGFRYGFFGISDISPWISLIIVLFFLFFVSIIAICMLAKGYKLRH